MPSCTICTNQAVNDPEAMHTECKQIINDTKNDPLSVRIYLAYHKQGDDLKNNTAYANGVVDPYKSFENMSYHMDWVSKQLKKISAVFKDADPKEFDLLADTHVIRLIGPRKYLILLIEKGLALLNT